MYEETHIVYNKIREHLNLNDEALALLGYSKDKIDKSIKLCTAQGMSRTQAAKTVFNLWIKADSDTQPPSHKEMCLMGFEYINDQWVHSDYPDIIITKEQQAGKTFNEVEIIVLARKQRNDAV
jgi:hypothetical protein